MLGQQIAQQRRSISRIWIRRAIIILTIITFLSYISWITVYLLQLFHIIHFSGITTLFTVLGVFGTTAGIPAALLGFLQHFLSLFPEEVITHSDEPIIPYQNIRGNPPPTHPDTVHQRESLVKHVYDQLMHKDTSALVITGLPHAGKSALAGLLYNHAEKQRHKRIRNLLRRIKHQRYFAAEPLWLRIHSETIELKDIAGTLFYGIGQSLPPDFLTSNAHNQVRMVHEALNHMKKPRLLIIDHIDRLLNVQTGQVLYENSHIGQWLDVVNSQKCKCPIIFTSRIWPQGADNHVPLHMKEYLINALEVDEWIEMLRKHRGNVTPEELQRAIEHCKGQAPSLKLLMTLLKRHPKLSVVDLLADPLYAHRLEEETERFFDPVYRQLDAVQRELLLAFSVFREPVSLDAAIPIRDALQRIWDDRIKKIKTEYIPALEGLRIQHLLINSPRHKHQDTRYHVPPLISVAIMRYFNDSDEQANMEAKHDAHRRAAKYYENLLVHSEAHHDTYIQNLREAIIHHCYGEEWKAGYNLLNNPQILTNPGNLINDKDLQEILQLFAPLERWCTNPSERAAIAERIGTIYGDLDRKERALKFYKQALNAFEEVGRDAVTSTLLNSMGKLFCESRKDSAAVACFLWIKRLPDSDNGQLALDREIAQRQLEKLCRKLGVEEYERLRIHLNLRELEVIQDAFLS